MLIKLRFRFPEVLLGILLAVAIFAMGMLFASSFTAPPQRSAEHSTSAEKTTKEDVKHGFWEKTADDPVAYFTLWLMGFTGVMALATIGLGVATILLYLAGGRQLRLAREEFNATHRPRIIVRGARLASKGERGTPARVDYEVVNIGDSHATVINLHAFAYVQLTGTGFNPFWNAPLPEPDRERFPVISGEHVVVCTECPSVDWQYDDFKYSDGQVFVLGVVTYVGPDNVKRITGFCRRYSRDSGAWHAEKESDYEYAY